MNDLSAFQRDILFLVAGLDNPTSHELKNHMEKYRESGVTIERIEPNVRSLKNKNLISEHSNTEGYTITNSGIHNIWSRREFEKELIQNM